MSATVVFAGVSGQRTLDGPAAFIQAIVQCAERDTCFANPVDKQLLATVITKAQEVGIASGNTGRCIHAPDNRQSLESLTRQILGARFSFLFPRNCKPGIEIQET